MIAKICCCLLALLVYVQYLLYLMHMLQLNTYKNNEQSAWNKKNSAILAKRQKQSGARHRVRLQIQGK